VLVSSGGYFSAETTVANMIQAMASFDGASSTGRGALFETASAGLLREDPGVLAAGRDHALHR